MGDIVSRDSRHGKLRELPHFPAIPAPPIRGRETAGGKFMGMDTCLAGAKSSLGATMKGQSYELRH
jgi:hypothetical protein